MSDGNFSRIQPRHFLSWYESERLPIGFTNHLGEFQPMLHEFLFEQTHHNLFMTHTDRPLSIFTLGEEKVKPRKSSPLFTEPNANFCMARMASIFSSDLSLRTISSSVFFSQHLRIPRLPRAEAQLRCFSWAASHLPVLSVKSLPWWLMKPLPNAVKPA